MFPNNKDGGILHLQNTATTFYGNIHFAPVGLPTCASNSLLFCLLRSIPNDWLSPTNRHLGTYGIGQCGELHPFPLLNLRSLPLPAFADAQPLKHFVFKSY